MIRISDVFAICALMVCTGCAALSSRQAPQQSAEHRSGRSVTQKDTQVTQATEASEVRHHPTAYDGEWTVTEVGGRKIAADAEAPYICFTGGDGRFYASNGCNILNGNFTVGSGGSIIFSDVLSTRMLCPDIPYTAEISSVLNDGNTVTASIDNHSYGSTLTLKCQGKPVIKLTRSNLAMIDGEWEVTRIGDTKMSDPQLNIFFDSAEHTIHGNTGCNYFNGEIEHNPAVASGISFVKMNVTMRACPNADTERLMLVALEETCTYKLSGDHLTLIGEGGDHLMTLQRILKPAKK